MFHYLFTNDLRISHLESALMDAARCFGNDNVPSASEDKNANNNMSTLGFYFNLTTDSNCTKECNKGNVRKVVLNFIKKFQFPNPRTSKSLENCINDGIQLAPMRLILQSLYIMRMICPHQAFLGRKEIVDNIFFSEDVAKKRNPDISLLINKIVTNRGMNADVDIPDDDALEAKGCFWKQCSRQVREMVKVLLWSGCVAEDEHGNIYIKHDSLTRDNEADLFEIITYSEFWNPNPNMNAEGNKESYQKYMDIQKTETEERGSNNLISTLIYDTKINSEFSRNRIVFGAPGTGKSYLLERNRKALLGEENKENYERVTFHPDYSYANFAGTYKPVPCVDSDGKDAITYEYVPGPFMRVYVNALRSARTDDPKPYLLIIEEINRANVAAVFGDIFQLLDRDENNVSEYPIQASEDVRKYLAKELGGEPEDYSTLRLPDNMFIWATMNSADQGVFPMDTAFKRRWDFTYLGIDNNEDDIKDKYVAVGSEQKQHIEWNSLRKAINDFLANEKINEDKQLGPYFISRDIAVPEDGGTEIDSEKFCRVFKNKVIMYLFEDAAKQKRSKLFSGVKEGQNRYSKICEAFDKQGIDIFDESIRSKVNISKQEPDETESE